MRDNELKCPKCGFAVYSDSYERRCMKCDTKMKLIGKRKLIRQNARSNY